MSDVITAAYLATDLQIPLDHRFLGSRVEPGQVSTTRDIAEVHGVMTSVKVITVGNSSGIVLPRELLAHLRVKKGDTLYVLETPDGVRLTPYDPEFAKQMEAADEVMRSDRDALRKLAE